MKKIITLCLIGISFLAAAQKNTHLFEVSDKITLASNGHANYPIVIAANASLKVKHAAAELASYLYKITGANFTIKEGDVNNGILVGVLGDFPKIDFKPDFNPQHPAESQGYEIKSHPKGVYIIGATPLAVEYAVFDFLGRFGYRRYFPMEKWEIIPKKSTLTFAAHIKEIPDYFHRRIWPGFGVWPEYKTSSEKWNLVNRNGGYPLRTGHSYDSIVINNQNEFKKHPEYYALVKGIRTVGQENAKFCISNPDLRKLVADYAVRRFEADPELMSISADPSDGGGWCECEACLKTGTPSTRVVLLANTVAKAVRERFPNKRIGMYAYGLHSPPPDIDVDQDVVVSVATSFIRGGLTLEEIIQGWQKRKAVLGIREYYDVYIWSKLLPGKSLGSNLDYLKKTIPKFYNSGARYLSSEASDDWGPSGLGYYIADKMMWNIKDSEHVNLYVEDFMNNCFGPAAAPMKEYYTLLDGSKPKVLSSDLLGRMYSLLDQSLKLTIAYPDITTRINDLVLYTRYVEMYLKFEKAQGNLQKNSFNDMTAFIASIKDSRMLHTLAIAEGKHWKQLAPSPESYVSQNWKNPTAYTSKQINTIIQEGIATNELLDFETVDFSEDLIPASQLSKEEYPLGYLKSRRGERSYYTWVNKDLAPIIIKVTGGLIPTYRDRGNVRVKLIKIGGASDDGTRETIIQEDTSTPPNGIENTVKLSPKQQGLHIVTIDDGNDKTDDTWTSYTKTFKSAGLLEGTFYFYVPKGTKKIGFYSKLKKGELLDPEGKPVFTANNTNSYKSFSIPAGNDGKFWCFKEVNGEINLLTVPPYFSTNAKLLLIPKEVVTKDELNK